MSLGHSLGDLFLGASQRARGGRGQRHGVRETLQQLGRVTDSCHWLAVRERREVGHTSGSVHTLKTFRHFLDPASRSLMEEAQTHQPRNPRSQA